MTLVKLASLLVLGLLFASCGGGGNSGASSSPSPTSPSPSPTAPNITGNWDIAAQSAVTAGTVEVGGSLVSSGTQISGVVHILNSLCFDPAHDVSVSGSITAGSNAVTLTSASIAGQVVTVNGTASADGKTLSNGTYSIAGGCGGGDHGSITGFIVPPFSNTYTGTFLSASGGTPVGVSVTTSQIPSPDGHGLFHVTGTVAFANSVCFANATIQNSGIAGSFLSLDMLANTGADVVFSGNITDSSGKTIGGSYQVNSGNCAGDNGSGTVSSGQNITVSVSPQSITLLPNGTQQFSATVNGTTNTSVRWTAGGVQGGNSTVGTISSSGLYTAPAVPPVPSTVTITAISVADATKSGTASVNIQSLNITVNVSPQSVTLPPSGTQQFTATVTGPSNTAVTWAAGGVQGGNSTVGTISSSGLYTAPAVAPSPSTVTIAATSVADPTKSGTAVADIRVHHDNQDPQSGPIKLGTSGGNSTDTTRSGNSLFCCSGTLGSLVSRAGTLYILSNNHVLNKSDHGAVGDPISQPGLADSNCGQSGIRTVANTSQAAPLNTSNVDAAIAQIVSGQVDTSGTILDLAATGQAAQPSSITGVPTVNQVVAKSGDATGLTCSTVAATNALIRVTYSTSCQGGTNFDVTYNNQVAILGANFSNNGDSGSLIVDSSNSRPVALLYAGSDSGTVGNPIQNVYNALKDGNGVAPQVVGGPDHAVACPSGSQAQPEISSLQSKQVLPEGEVSRATIARNHHRFELMQDSAVDAVEVGRSADNPDEPAVIVILRRQATLPIPAQVDGVRTRLIFSSATATNAASVSINELELSRARTAKERHAEELMMNNAILGVGVGASDDSPGESALVVFVEQGKAGKAVTIPKSIDGVRTRLIFTDPFRTFNWGNRTVKACSRR